MILSSRGWAKRLNLTEKIIWVLMLTLLSSFYIFMTYSWGRYVFLGVTLLIAVFSVAVNRMRFKATLDSFHYHFLVLIAFTFMSAAWGLTTSDPIGKGVSFAEIFLCLFIVYNYCAFRDDGVYQLLSVIKWSGYVVSIYSLIYYGVDFIKEMVESGVRISNEYANINSIGMLVALSITIQIDQLFANRKVSLSALFCIPSFYMLVATQSRKAFIMLIAGVVVSAVFRNVDSKNGVKTAVRIIMIAAVSYIVIRQVLQLPIFAGIMKRLNNLEAYFTGEGDMGASAETRRVLIEIGMKQFRNSPILGIGIGCAHIIANQSIGMDAYLHNNYVELLACGGIVGFIIFYSFHIDLFMTFLRKRVFAADEAYLTCAALMIILFSMDYGCVSVYSKADYFFFMTFFLEAKRIKENDISVLYYR